MDYTFIAAYYTFILVLTDFTFLTEHVLISAKVPYPRGVRMRYTLSDYGLSAHLYPKKHDESFFCEDIKDTLNSRLVISGFKHS